MKVNFPSLQAKVLRGAEEACLPDSAATTSQDRSRAFETTEAFSLRANIAVPVKS